MKFIQHYIISDKYIDHYICFCSWNFVQEGNSTYKDASRFTLYEKALKIWAKWVDTQVDSTKTKVFFQGVSPDHKE